MFGVILMSRSALSWLDVLLQCLCLLTRLYGTFFPAQTLVVQHVHTKSINDSSSMPRHWLQAGGVTVVFLVSVVVAVCVGVVSGLSTKYKIVTICSIGVLNIVLLK